MSAIYPIKMPRTSPETHAQREIRMFREQAETLRKAERRAMLRRFAANLLDKAKRARNEPRPLSKDGVC